MADPRVTFRIRGDSTKMAQQLVDAIVAATGETRAEVVARLNRALEPGVEPLAVHWPVAAVSAPEGATE